VAAYEQIFVGARYLSFLELFALGLRDLRLTLLARLAFPLRTIASSLPRSGWMILRPRLTTASFRSRNVIRFRFLQIVKKIVCAGLRCY
jgi:hypothetical protein